MSNLATEARWRVRWRAAGSLAGASATATWWLSSIGQYHGPDHMIGPYQVPLFVEYGVGVTAIGAGAVAAVATVVSARPRRGVAGSAAVLLVLAVVVAAGSWRVMTAGVDGANIGGGLLALIVPFVLAALLFAAVSAERRSRGGFLPHYRLLAVLTWTAAPILFGLIWVGAHP